jgi:D-glycero-D-manno-heptose 1,7-bisphosphate phosphatase
MRQAVILVGGKGTRLGASTRDTPKPLLPIVGDTRFLDYLIDNVARHGIEEILLLAGHLGEQVEARYAGRVVRGARIAVIREPAPAGTAGALPLIADRLDDVFLMSNGDSYFDVNYLALSAALTSRDIGVLALRRVEDAGRFGRVSFDGSRITGFHEKDPAWSGGGLISGGVYVLRRQVLDLVTASPCSIETDIFPRLAADGRLGGVSGEGFFIDIGVPETLAEARRDFPARMRRPAVFFDRDGTINRDGGYTHKVEDLTFLPGAVEAIRACNDAGALAIVVTNQAGLARGLYDEEQMHAFHARMQDELRRQGAHIDAFYHCPFHADGSVADFRRPAHPDRKPAPGMIRRAMLEWPIEPAGSFLVGDHDNDVAAATAAGLPAHKVEPGTLHPIVMRELARRPEAPSLRSDHAAALKVRAGEARRWLHEAALPFWWDIGFDRVAGCFHEKVDGEGRPVTGPRRVRVQARQTFVYSIAGQLGWQGPWQEATSAGAAVLLERGIRPDGGTIHRLDATGRPDDLRRDLYDVAFVVFALARAGKALARPDLLAAAEQVCDWTFTHWAHPAGGLMEGDITPTPPRRQNPHMHMLEALLALHEANGDPRHLDRAWVLVDLLRHRFVSPRWNALLEYFDDGWSPQPGEEGRIAEPGHQFEWAWLLDRYRRNGGESAADIAERIRINGEVYGIDPAGYAIDETWAEGGVRTATSRLWPHTERIKANIVRFETSGDPRAAEATLQACDALASYLDPRGFWRDRRRPDGSFVDEPAPASSFYHIVMAYSELLRVTDSV